MFWLPLTFFRTLPFLHQYNERNMFRIWSTNSNFFVKKEDHARRSSIHKQGKTNIMMSSCLRLHILFCKGVVQLKKNANTVTLIFSLVLFLKLNTQCNNKRSYVDRYQLALISGESHFIENIKVGRICQRNYSSFVLVVGG